jgi:transcription initiation factor TFIIIB Brf1 subunit/transcription initiation factor TFIIB
MVGKCWKVGQWSRRPEPIEIVRETEKCYFFMVTDWRNKQEERRELKDGNNIFATWEEAKAWMVSSAEKSLEYAKQEVDRKRSALEVIKVMKQGEI